MNQHLIIPDTQIKPELEDFRHLDALGNYIVTHKPEVIVFLGDWYDMPSLSSHDAKHVVELRSYKMDVQAGNDRMQKIMRTIKETARKSKNYNPRTVFLMGNHEFRINRFIKESPKLLGAISLDHLRLHDLEVHEFLKIVQIDGIHYSHYFANPMTGQPYGGQALTILKNLGYSFTAGHKQCLDIARIDQTNGNVVQGLIAGALYLHLEEYKSNQGNEHWRGIVHKRNVHDGQYDLETIHINNLISEYL